MFLLVLSSPSGLKLYSDAQGNVIIFAVSSNHRYYKITQSESVRVTTTPHNFLRSPHSLPVFLVFFSFACSELFSRLVLLLFPMRSILDFHCPDSVSLTHALLMFMWLRESCSVCVCCLVVNSTQTPQRKSISCD